MKTLSILFDLDGTLTDSGEGIINCAAYALEMLGLPVPPRETMGIFVGPPLQDTFQSFGVPAEQAEEAVRIFRSRYVPIGKFENKPYDGIREVLDDLIRQGHRLYVATSKPECTTLEILDHFDLSRYFTKICGATLDGVRSSKSQVIACLLDSGVSREEAVMVGDTAYDVLGAASHGIPAIGVAWGYGCVADMKKAGAAAIADTPEELFSLLCQMAKSGQS